MEIGRDTSLAHYGKQVESRRRRGEKGASPDDDVVREACWAWNLIEYGLNISQRALNRVYQKREGVEELVESGRRVGRRKAVCDGLCVDLLELINAGAVVEIKIDWAVGNSGEE